MVEKVKQYFPKIVVVLNAGAVMDTQWFYAEGIVDDLCHGGDDLCYCNFGKIQYTVIK